MQFEIYLIIHIVAFIDPRLYAPYIHISVVYVLANVADLKRARSSCCKNKWARNTQRQPALFHTF